MNMPIGTSAACWVAMVASWCLVVPAILRADPTGTPVAIVEDTTPGVRALAPLDLLREGDSFVLEVGEGAIIAYLQSCQRENIQGSRQGNRVVIGRTQSSVDGGAVSRQAIACDAAALALTPDQANQSAALAFRQPDAAAGVDAIAALATVVMSTRHPLVIAPDLAEISVESLRQAGTRQVRQARNGVIALTDASSPLDKGGVYRLEGAGRSIVFRIGRGATDAPLPLLKRIIRF